MIHPVDCLPALPINHPDQSIHPSGSGLRGSRRKGYIISIPGASGDKPPAGKVETRKSPAGWLLAGDPIEWMLFALEGILHFSLVPRSQQCLYHVGRNHVCPKGWLDFHKTDRIPRSSESTLSLCFFVVHGAVWKG